MPPPPPAEPFAPRIFLGPALRTQPDRRLVKLVREGYETAFEEIVRRYRKPLDRFAAAIVGGRSEDVTQDAFSKALLALRGTTTEIELRPWLYRIVRNTALNDLRDGPPPTEELGEAIAGGQSAAVEAERREEIAELMARLRALPEPQRAALVMRELEGLSHEEIAAALGVSGGAARQAIYRGRLALRDGLGLLIPLPLLRMLFDHGAEAAGEGAGGAGGAVAVAGAASAAGGGGGAALGGLGAAGALKAGVATALIAGSVGAGVAVQQHREGNPTPEPAAASAALLPTAASGGSSSGSSGNGAQAPPAGSDGRRGDGRGSDDDGDRGKEDDDRHGHGRGSDDDRESSAEDDSGSKGSSGGDGHGSGHGERSGHNDGDDRGGDDSGGRRSGRQISGGGSGGDDSGSGGHGSGSSESGDDGDGGSSTPPPPVEPIPEVDDDSGGDSGSGGSGSGGDDPGGEDL